MRAQWIVIGCVALAMAATGNGRAEESAALATQPIPDTQPTTEPASPMQALLDGSSEATTQPAAQPTTQPWKKRRRAADPDKVLDRMLRARPGSVRPVQPAPEEDAKKIKKQKTVAPEDEGRIPPKREGDMITQRVGRLQKSEDGRDWEFHFESDGRRLEDPPMIVLPSRLLSDMESALEKSDANLRFRITGMITTYHGQNYLLVEKANLISTAEEQ